MFTRDICNSIKIHSLFPNREEKQRVASMIIERYVGNLGGDTVSNTYNFLIHTNSIYFSIQE